MAKKNKNIILKRQHRHPLPGTSPGAIKVPEGAFNTSIELITYHQQEIATQSIQSIDDLKKGMADQGKFYWIDIKGLANELFFESLAQYLNIHRLQLEDIFNVYQRSKFEDHEHYLFLVSRMLYYQNGSLVNEQVSFICGSNFLVTVQEQPQDCLDPIRTRLRGGKGAIRSLGSCYLLYAVMDTILDHYFPLLDSVNDQLDQWQDQLIDNPSKEAINQVLKTKRELMLLRRVVYAERDKQNDIIRSQIDLIPDQVKIYYRDSYDHCMQLYEMIDSAKEITGSLLDVYMSAVSNKLNQVMKVLTIISTIFIPLTFITGLYGMNFMFVNDKTGETYPFNMPELHQPYGYLTVIGVMVLVVVVQLIFFYRKGWLTK